MLKNQYYVLSRLPLLLEYSIHQEWLLASRFLRHTAFYHVQNQTDDALLPLTRSTSLLVRTLLQNLNTNY